MIDRIYMTKERFEEEIKKGNMPHKTYEDYVASVNKLYDELDAEVDEDLDEDRKEVNEEINESK